MGRGCGARYGSSPPPSPTLTPQRPCWLPDDPPFPATHPSQHEKIANLPPPPRELLAANAASAITRSRGFGRTAEFNPILGSWVDPSREAAARAHKAAEHVERGNLARDRQLKHLQSFNLLTGRPVVQEPPLPPPRAPSDALSSRVPYNILTAAPLPDLLLTARAADPAQAARAQGDPARPLYNHAPTLVRRRAIDIVTSRFIVGDAEKSAAEADAARERSVRRFWQTRNFDPLLQRFEDPARDAAYEDAARQAEAVQGVAQAARLPACIRYTQGRAYDNVLHAPRDPGVLELLDTMESRPLRRMRARAAEERLAAEGEAAAQRAEARRFAAQQQQRVAVELADPREYSVISALPRDAAASARNLAGRRVSAWEKVERGLAAGDGGGLGAWARVDAAPPPTPLRAPERK